MPLIPTGPGYRTPSPGWSRNPLLHSARPYNAGRVVTQDSTFRRTTMPGNQQRPAMPAPPRRPGPTPPGKYRSLGAYMMGGRPATAPAAVPNDNRPQRTDLAAQYQQQIDAANQANEERYQEILAGYDERAQEAMRYADLAQNQQYRQEMDAINDNLASRGLANSTIQGKQASQAYERSAMTPLQTGLQTSGDRLRFMERREDVGPDPQQLIALSQMQGQADALNQQRIGETAQEIGQAVDARIGSQMNAPRNYTPTPVTRNVGMLGAPIMMGGGPMPWAYAGGGMSPQAQRYAMMRQMQPQGGGLQQVGQGVGQMLQSLVPQARAAANRQADAERRQRRRELYLANNRPFERAPAAPEAAAPAGPPPVDPNIPSLLNPRPNYNTPINPPETMEIRTPLGGNPPSVPHWSQAQAVQDAVNAQYPTQQMLIEQQMAERAQQEAQLRAGIPQSYGGDMPTPMPNPNARLPGYSPTMDPRTLPYPRFGAHYQNWLEWLRTMGPILDNR